MGEERGEVVGLGDEDGVGGAGEAGEDVGTEVLVEVSGWRRRIEIGLHLGGGWGGEI